jgi:NAD(P)-dependent dehydrogenase (short-subunit alcohol dehydrogenase family)
MGHAIVSYLLTTKSANVIVIARTAPTDDLLFANEHSDHYTYLKYDITDPNASKAAAISANEKYGGRIDAVILNHGVLDPVAKVADADLEAWKKNFDINFFGCVGLVGHALLEEMGD